MCTGEGLRFYFYFYERNERLCINDVLSSSLKIVNKTRIIYDLSTLRVIKIKEIISVVKILPFYQIN